MRKHDPSHVGAMFEAWIAICLAAGRRGVGVTYALETADAGLRDALGVALARLGYPDAMVSAHRLGAAFCRLRGRFDAAGRWLDVAPTQPAATWHVVTPVSMP